MDAFLLRHVSDENASFLIEKITLEKPGERPKIRDAPLNGFPI